MFRYSKNKSCQIVGWVYSKDNPVGDYYIDFGIYDVYKPATADFVNGYERSILLDFNPDGNIWELIWMIDGLSGFGSGDPYQDELDYYHLL